MYINNPKRYNINVNAMMSLYFYLRTVICTNVNVKYEWKFENEKF